MTDFNQTVTKIMQRAVNKIITSTDLDNVGQSYISQRVISAIIKPILTKFSSRMMPLPGLSCICVQAFTSLP